MGRRQIGDDSGAFDPTVNSHLRLLEHIAIKGFQAGAVLAVPLVPLALKIRRRPVTLAAVTAGAAGFALIGTAASAAAGLAKMRTMDTDGVTDRVYRLHYNDGQVRTDRFARAGAGIGAAVLTAATVAGFSASLPVALLGGAAIGSAVGIAAHVATSGQIASARNVTKEL
eukprot:Opistho-2@37345